MKNFLPPILYLLAIGFLPLVLATAKAISFEKLKDRTFRKTVAKDFLRTFPACALAALPLMIFPGAAKWYLLGIHLVFFPLFVLEFGHVWYFGARIGINTFYSLFVSTAAETGEYIRQNLSVFNVLAAFVPFFAIAYGLWLLPPPAYASETWHWAAVAVTVALVVPMVQNSLKKHDYQRKTSYWLNPYVSLAYHYLKFRINYRALREMILAHAAPPFAKIRSRLEGAARETYVILIGESANSHHFHCYGYERETTPFTEKIAGLRRFAGVRSQFAQTLPSLEKTITFATVKEPDLLYKKGSLIDYFHEAGFKVWWYSNQGALDDTAITAMTTHADVSKCFNFADMKRFEAAGFDANMLGDYEKALDDPAPKKAVFLHLLGSHSAYVNRYPSEFRHFEDAPPKKGHLSVDKQAMINSYDDSIRYTDFVISEAIRLLSAREGVKGLVYFSDHGEDVYDTNEDKSLGHGAIANEPMISVPFYVWISDELDRLRPDLRRAAAKSDYKLEDAIHTVIDVASLENDDFDASKSIFEKAAE